MCRETLQHGEIKKQNVVTGSSAEVEFRAVAQGICEGLLLGKLFKEMQVRVKHLIKIYCDNKTTINILLNPI